MELTIGAKTFNSCHFQMKPFLAIEQMFKLLLNILCHVHGIQINGSVVR